MSYYKSYKNMYFLHVKNDDFFLLKKCEKVLKNKGSKNVAFSGLIKICQNHVKIV